MRYVQINITSNQDSVSVGLQKLKTIHSEKNICVEPVHSHTAARNVTQPLRMGREQG